MSPTLATTFAGIPCLNPFWLASAPPTNCGEQIMRAFDAGWGGAVWKTIGEPITNVSSRYSSIDFEGRRMMGFNNIELISDRPIETNLREIAEVKRRYPKHVVIASLMVASHRETWHDIVQRSEDAGADGLELNFGCPHGMSERGMGSAVGQVPEYCEQITGWVKEKARTPVIVKLTPNISDIRMPARAARRAGADALSAINTINSITSIDLDTFEPRPLVDGKSSHGGYCGPAVKPIALNMVQQIMSDGGADPEAMLPLSGIGGIATWRDAAEFFLLGCGNVQVCTAAMHYGYRIVEDMADGLLGWMRDKGFATLDDFRGPLFTERGASGSSSTSTTASSPRSTPTSASAASSATPPAGTAHTNASTSTAPPAATSVCTTGKTRATPTASPISTASPPPPWSSPPPPGPSPRHPSPSST